MIRVKDYSGHKTWRFIYGALFVANLYFMKDIESPLATGIIAVVTAFLFWGQQLSINDIEKNR